MPGSSISPRLRHWELAIAARPRRAIAFLKLVIVIVVILFVRREIRIDFREDLVAGALDIHVETLEHAGGDALTLAQQSEQKMCSVPT